MYASKTQELYKHAMFKFYVIDDYLIVMLDNTPIN